MLRGPKGGRTGEFRLEKRTKFGGIPGVMPGSREFPWGRQHRLTPRQGRFRAQGQGQGRTRLCFPQMRPGRGLPAGLRFPKERTGAAVWYWESGQLDFGGWREEIQASPDPPLEP